VLRGRVHTLRARVALGAAGSILVAIVLFGGAVIGLVHYELRRSLDSSLRQRAFGVAQLAVSAPALLGQPGALESSVSGRLIAVEVVDSHGALVDRSLALGALLLPLAGPGEAAIKRGVTGYEDTVIGGRSYRLFAAPIARAGGPAAGGAVLVASDTTDIGTTTRRLRAVLTVSAVGATVLALLLAFGLARRGLRPLRRLVDAAAEIERTADPSRRLPEPAAADEIGELTGVLNRMLAALERSREGERRFLADASHELRTPVTALLGNVEYAARHGATDEVLADMQSEAARLARLVDDLLVLERARGTDAGGERVPVDLVQIARDVVGAQPDDRVALAPGPSDAVVSGEPDALRRALANLVENALVHGPAGGRVTIAVGAAPGLVRLSVHDEGPGPGGSEHLFERFWRGQEASGKAGSGLGLSIVAAIAERHGGRVTVDGSEFAIELPIDVV
jgi:two-component system OmpR family sensor kinase